MNNKRHRGIEAQRQKEKTLRLCYFVPLCLSFFIVLISSAFAGESINISADYLEYLSQTNTYIARGSVKILFEDTSLSADKIRLNNITSDAVAEGNVVYEDTETITKADRMEINLKTKLGKIYNSYIFYKKRNYHIRGGNLKKLGEKSYFLDKATVTTCDADPPEWHISGKNIKAIQHKNIKSRDTTFYIKNKPVLYSPYFQAPLLKERQTGLLVPSLGYSNTKGFTFKQGFFWAIKDNIDATIYLDYYSEKGLAKGLDYRYIITPETNGELWMYHLRDNDLRRDFLEIKSYHNQKLPYEMSGYLKLHVVNEFDYYEEFESTSSGRFGLSSWETDPFGFASEERLQKYLESNLHLSKPFYGGRAYLLGQYRQSLEGSSDTIPQNLPEIGLILNTRSIGPVSFNMAVKGANFRMVDGQQGQRFDLNPNLYLSYGKLINITQKIGMRETAYFLEAPAKNENRLFFDLSSTLTTRFFKRYSSLIHVIEPSLEYAYTPALDNADIPVNDFDSIDSIPEENDIVYSITNRFAGFAPKNLEAIFSLSQNYSFLNTEKPFTPVLAEANLLSNHLDFSVNTSYDIYEAIISETIASVKLKGKKGFIGIGKNFRRSTLLDQYSIEAGFNRYGKPVPVGIYGKLWYDFKEDEVQESNLKTIYKSQCWGITVSYTKKPYEYRIMFGIEFTGLGALKIG